MDFIIAHKWGLLITLATSFVLGLLFMGGPGFLVGELVERLSPYGYDPMRVHGDEVWPNMIFLSLFMPWCFYALYLATHHFAERLPTFAVVIICLLLTTAISCLLYLAKFPFSKYPPSQQEQSKQE